MNGQRLIEQDSVSIAVVHKIVESTFAAIDRQNVDLTRYHLLASLTKRWKSRPEIECLDLVLTAAPPVDADYFMTFGRDTLYIADRSPYWIVKSPMRSIRR